MTNCPSGKYAYKSPNTGYTFCVTGSNPKCKATYGKWSECKILRNWKTSSYSYRYKTAGLTTKICPTTQRRCCPGHVGKHCRPCKEGTYYNSFDHSGTGKCSKCAKGFYSTLGSARCMPLIAAKKDTAAALQKTAGHTAKPTPAPTPLWDMNTYHKSTGAKGYAEAGKAVSFDAPNQIKTGHYAYSGGTGALPRKTGVARDSKYYKNQASSHAKVYKRTAAPTAAPTPKSTFKVKFCKNGNEFVMEGWVGACTGKNYCKNCECKRAYGKSSSNVPGRTHSFLGSTKVVGATKTAFWKGKHSCGSPYNKMPKGHVCKHVSCTYKNNMVMVKHGRHNNIACENLIAASKGKYTYKSNAFKKIDEKNCAEKKADSGKHRCGFNKHSGECRCLCNGKGKSVADLHQLAQERQEGVSPPVQVSRP